MYSELVEVAHKWKRIGLALRLSPNLLDKIHYKNYVDVENYLRDVLTEWLRKAYSTARFGDPSWKMLVEAVAHPAGGSDRALAGRIAKKYNGEYYVCRCANEVKVKLCLFIISFFLLCLSSSYAYLTPSPSVPYLLSPFPSSPSPPPHSHLSLTSPSPLPPHPPQSVNSELVISHHAGMSGGVGHCRH